MAVDAAVEAPQDPAARGFNGRLLSLVDPPASGEPLSREWLAQVGRSAGGEYLDGRLVLKRLTEDGLAVPGNDPLYQYLGVFRLYGEIFKAQHEEQMAALRSMLDEARQAMARSLADASAGGAAAAAARRVEDEAALKRLSADADARSSGAAAKLRAAMAEEREIFTAAIVVATADALARIDRAKSARAARGRLWRPFGDLGSAWWAVRGRSAAAWAALLALSVIAGLALLWVLGRFGPGHGGR